jgi:hypothetical protein
MKLLEDKHISVVAGVMFLIPRFVVFLQIFLALGVVNSADCQAFTCRLQCSGYEVDVAEDYQNDWTGKCPDVVWRLQPAAANNINK